MTIHRDGPRSRSSAADTARQFEKPAAGGETMAGRFPMRLDRSALFLVLSNLVTIAVAVFQNWDLADVMWIYWGQSVVIGFFNWKRIRLLRNFSTEGVTFNGRAVQPTEATRRKTATFFALHYGFFHLMYLLFLLTQASDLTGKDVLGILACIAVFAVNHRYSFYHNLERDLAGRPNIGIIMLFPYARILPMHVTIIFGEMFAGHRAGVLILFLGLKTLADLIMHLIEHRSSR